MADTNQMIQLIAVTKQAECEYQNAINIFIALFSKNQFATILNIIT